MCTRLHSTVDSEHVTFFSLTRVIFVHRGTLQYNQSMFVFWGMTRVCGGHMATVQYGRPTVRVTSYRVSCSRWRRLPGTCQEITQYSTGDVQYWKRTVREAYSTWYVVQSRLQCIEAFVWHAPREYSEPAVQWEYRGVQGSTVIQ